MHRVAFAAGADQEYVANQVGHEDVTTANRIYRYVLQRRWRGEIGYMPVGTEPFAERHRRRGALEDEISATGIVEAARRMGWTGPPPSSPREVFDRANAGDEVATAVLDAVARRSGMADRRRRHLGGDEA